VKLAADGRLLHEIQTVELITYIYDVDFALDYDNNDVHTHDIVMRDYSNVVNEMTGEKFRDFYCVERLRHFYNKDIYSDCHSTVNERCTIRTS
jgi:hypothetical protein